MSLYPYYMAVAATLNPLPPGLLYDYDADHLSASLAAWPNSGTTAGADLHLVNPGGVVLNVGGGPGGHNIVRFTGNSYYQGTQNVGISGSAERTLLTIYSCPLNQGVMAWGETDYGKSFDLYHYSNPARGLRHFYGGGFDMPGFQPPPAIMALLECYKQSTSHPVPDGVAYEAWCNGQYSGSAEGQVIHTTDSPLRLGQDISFLSTQPRALVRQLIWNRALTAAELQQVRDWVSATYLLTC